MCWFQYLPPFLEWSSLGHGNRIWFPVLTRRDPGRDRKRTGGWYSVWDLTVSRTTQVLIPVEEQGEVSSGYTDRDWVLSTLHRSSESVYPMGYCIRVRNSNPIRPKFKVETVTEPISWTGPRLRVVRSQRSSHFTSVIIREGGLNCMLLRFTLLLSLSKSLTPNSNTTATGIILLMSYVSSNSPRPLNSPPRPFSVPGPESDEGLSFHGDYTKPLPSLGSHPSPHYPMDPPSSPLHS